MRLEGLAGHLAGVDAVVDTLGITTTRRRPATDFFTTTSRNLLEAEPGLADVQVATRAGPSVVMEAGQLQALAHQSGLDWANPQGLRRVVIRSAAPTPHTPLSATPTATSGCCRKSGNGCQAG